jgi:hypothetical protein
MIGDLPVGAAPQMALESLVEKLASLEAWQLIMEDPGIRERPMTPQLRRFLMTGTDCLPATPQGRLASCRAARRNTVHLWTEPLAALR